MPTYEYTCQECGNKFEQLHPVSARPGPCPKCESLKIERAFRTAPNMQATSEMRRMNWSTEDKKKENKDWCDQRAEDAQNYKRTGH